MINDEKKSILIIDDDITIRKLIGFHLKNNNYQVHEANGPEKAFDTLAGEKIDLVLCDVTMGDMDGYTFCSKVRENENFRALPFVFVTAKNSMEDKSRALEAGGDDIITKPFDINDLLLKVQALLRRTDIYKTYGAKKNLEKSFSEPAETSALSTILLVDDDLSLAKLFQYNLNKSGFDCRIASNVQEGMQLAKEINPDIIISDIMMPNVDGFMFRKMLLAEPQLKSVPFVFLTSKSDEEDILDGYDLGITEYVLKTAGPRVVVAKVSAIIKSLGKERQKVVTELHQAADSLRVKVVPDNNPVFNGFKISHWHQPFQGIPGGDFIDYFELDENNFAVILGDVMGKKWGAWYFAFAYAGYVRSAIRVVLQVAKEFSPSEIMEQVNKSVYRDAKVSEVFATLSIVILNWKDRTLKYTGAGDLPLLYKDGITNEVKKIQSKGMLLGFSADGKYVDTELKLNPGDIIFLTTDGIIESRNASGEQFGASKLNETIQSIGQNEDPDEALKKEFCEFTGAKLEDDISLITIKVM
jgi:sigma-B regulation protein RsbU (phosphoserine phosphatase)